MINLHERPRDNILGLLLVVEHLVGEPGRGRTILAKIAVIDGVPMECRRGKTAPERFKFCQQQQRQGGNGKKKPIFFVFLQVCILMTTGHFRRQN